MYSFKASYNVLSHTHWGVNLSGGGGVALGVVESNEKKSLQILDLLRLASLYRCVSF